MRIRPGPGFTVVIMAFSLAGCGTTRMSDTQRTATEQLLVSHAIDQVVSELDFSGLEGKPVYLDAQYLDGTVDRGYLVSSLRQRLMAQGCLLQEDRSKATYVVEARSGGVGTDRHALLVGIPQMNVPAFVPGQPSQIPEIPFAKKTDQEGYAKIAVFAYNRVTGQLLWQSGVAKAMSTSKDTWILGAGPFQQGTIRDGTEFAGEPLSIPHFIEKEKSIPPAEAPGPTLTEEASWPENPPAGSKRLAHILGSVPVEQRIPTLDSARPILDVLSDPFRPHLLNAWPWTAIEDSPDSSAPEPKPGPPPPPGPDTAAISIDFSAWGSETAVKSLETAPRAVVEGPGGSKAD
jgi:hypothetical protein